LERRVLHKAVLLVIFNRPETTAIVFKSIREAKPPRLYVAADGPRANKPEDVKRCEEARRIATNVDWECEVHTLFSDKNLGCGLGPTTAISWFFKNETEGIILEDDCLPSQSFFLYCQELLEYYRDDYRVMHISGNNMDTMHRREKEYSYTFSNFIYSWGWATWRRAWQFHDFYLSQYPEIKQKRYLLNVYDSIYERDFFQYVFSKMHQGDNRTNRDRIWDYQWQFALYVQSGLAIHPNRNLVRNIGFGMNATNTTSSNGTGSNLPLEEIQLPLRHPEFVMVNKIRDRRIFEMGHTSQRSRIISRIKSFVPEPVLKNVLRTLNRFTD
jgi:hypothetical protein